MSKFTQDEWKYMEVDPISEELNTHKYVLWAVGERTLQSIGYIFTEANARLIAAAPEMYRMLVKVLDDTQNGQHASENDLIALLNTIDGEDREFNYMYPIP